MPDHYKVLLVEDNEVDRMAFERFVRIENLAYDYTIASSIAEARKLLSSQPFDIALMDYSLGDGTSLELFDAASQMPIIIITGSSDMQIAVETMKAGAYDFLPKDPQGNYLIALPITVKNTVERWQAQQEVTQYRNHLEKVVEERTAAWLEGEHRLSKIIELIPIIVFSLDLEAKFTFITGHTQEILGFNSVELIGKSLFTLFSQTSVDELGLQDIYSGRTHTRDIKINEHWLSVNVSAKWEDNKITGVIGVVHDISERKRAELAVAQERNLLRTLIDNIPDYIFIKDRDGRFVESNQAHADGANRSREEIISRTAMEVFSAEVATQFNIDDTYVLTTGKSIINEERLTTSPDGSKRWVLSTKIPLFDDQKSSIVGLVGISRNITERKEAEEDRLKAERLKIELAQERELIEMKQRFITTASHDFRTPLTIIKMGADMLETYDTRLSPERRLAKLKQIQAQVDRMVSLLNSVLTVSKGSAGRVAFSPKVLELEPFCTHIWEDMVELDQHKHEYHFHYQATIQTIKADEHLLQPIIVNLLSNAFKYTPSGGKIEFHVSNDDQFFAFEVKDTGFGIPKADQAHLFEPFYRANNVKNLEGTGLGLVIVKNYIELHGGSMSMQSEEGVGTTFIANLPLSAVPKTMMA